MQCNGVCALDVVVSDPSRVGDVDKLDCPVDDTSTVFDGIDEFMVAGDPGSDAIELQAVEADDTIDETPKSKAGLNSAVG